MGKWECERGHIATMPEGFFTNADSCGTCEQPKCIYRGDARLKKIDIAEIDPPAVTQETIPTSNQHSG
jgi:hypothetical protein